MWAHCERTNQKGVNMTKDEIIKQLRDMAKYPTVTLPRDTDALKSAADLLEQAEQAQPVAWFRYETVYEYRNQLARCTKDCIGAFPVYTSPPPRQPLTDEQIERLEAMCIDPIDSKGWGFLNRKSFARAIEAAHGIKGEA
jgi:hypothetical protein